MLFCISDELLLLDESQYSGIVTGKNVFEFADSIDFGKYSFIHTLEVCVDHSGVV